LEDEEVKQKIINIFGKNVLTGEEIDRKILRRKVFQNKKKLAQLNRILHPLIIRRIKEQVGHYQEGVMIIDAPLLIESGFYKTVDITVVVTAENETQVKRATNRGISKKEAEDIISAQMPLAEKKEFADHIIKNENGLNKTKEGVEKLWKKIQNQ